MEQNKTLLVILSVALFLAAILSVGLWFFYSREEFAGSPAAPEAAGNLTDDPIEWVRRNEIPALNQSETEPKDDLIIVYGQSETQPADPVREGAAPYPPEAQPPAITPPVKKQEVPAVVIPKSPPRPAAPKPAPQPQTKTVRVKEYSIQVGAFSNRDRVEELSEVLKEKGLAGQVFYADGPKLYRLRIGPYTNQAEAEKFLAWVRSIDGFQDSMIFERSATRTIVN
jgi:cell division septation protein DedD